MLFKHQLNMKKKDKNASYSADVLISKIKAGEISLKDLSKEFRINKEFVCEVLKVDGMQLKYVSKKLKNDRIVVLTAIMNDGKAIDFASDELQNDISFIIQAIKNKDYSADQKFWDFEWRNLDYLIAGWWHSRELIFTLINCFNAAVTEMDPTGGAVNDKEIMLECAKRDGYYALKNASVALKYDRELAIAGVSNNGWAFPHLIEEFRRDQEIALIAIKTFPKAVLYMPENILLDDEFIIKACKIYPSILMYYPENAIQILMKNMEHL